MFIIITLFSPITILYSVYGIIKDNTKWNKYYIYILVSLFLLGYAYFPVSINDLSRNAEEISWSIGRPFIEYCSPERNILVLKSCLFWIVGRLGDVRLLSALSLCVTYGIMVYITCDYANINGRNDLIPLVLLIQIMLLPAISVMEYSRSPIAFSLVCLAAYLEFVKKRKNIVIDLLYILPCFLHIGALPLLILRLLSGRHNATQLKRFLAVGMLVVIALLIGGSNRFVSDFVLSVFDRIVMYVLPHEMSQWEAFTNSNKLYLTYKLLVGFVCVFQLLCFARKKNKNDYDCFLGLLSLLVIMTCFISGNIYMRYFIVSVVASGVMYIDEQKLLLNKSSNMITTQLFFIFITSIFISFWQLLIDKDSVNIVDFIRCFIFNDIYTIVFDAISHIFFD